MSSEEFCITWNDHPRNVMGVLGRYLDDETLVDCSVAAEGKVLKAHRLVLSACSSYFELQFRGELKEEKVVVIEDIKFKDLKLLIVLMYKGVVSVPKERLRDFVRAAESLQIRGLRSDLVQNSLREATEMSVEGLASQLSHNSIRCSAISGGSSDLQSVSSIGKRLNGDTEPCTCTQMDVSEESVFSEPQSILESDSNRKTGFLAKNELSEEPKEEMDVQDTPIWESEGEDNPSVNDLCTAATAGEQIHAEFTPISSCICCANAPPILENEATSCVLNFSSVSATSSDTAWSSPFVHHVPNVQAACVLEGGSSYVLIDLAEQSVSVKIEPVVKTEDIPAVVSWHNEGTGDAMRSVLVAEVQSWEGDEAITADTSCQDSTDRNLEVAAAVPRIQSAELLNSTCNGFLSFAVAQKANEDVSVQEVKVEETETDEQCMRKECKSTDVKDSTVGNVLESCQQSYVDIDEDNMEKREHAMEGQKMIETVETDVAVEQSEVEDEDSAPLSERISKMKGKKSHRCSACLDVFHSVRDLRLHVKNLHKKKRCHRCQVCTATFDFRSQLMGHMRKHTGERPFQCDVCKVAFSHKNNLNKHKRIHTGERPFQCDVCERSFGFKSHLMTHMRTHTVERPFQCDVCEKSFNRKGNLTVHQRIHTGDRPFQCDVCKVSFIKKIDLVKHMRTHFGERPFQCEVCESTFNCKYTLTVHQRIHAGARPFQCDICTKSFRQNSSLSAHKYKHTGVSPFQCDVCKVAFCYKGALTRHKLIHTGERRFQCDVCAMTFTQKATLVNHMRTHSGERPFQCDICKMSSSRKSNLAVHKRIHTGERSFHCDICKMSFSRKSGLTEHKRIHTGERPFQCDVCKRFFPVKPSLKRHMRTHSV